jgi:para-aminobenzoate synthetase component 1
LAPDVLRDRVAVLPGPSLLDGAPGFGAAGRWSYLAAAPRLVFLAVGDRWAIRGRAALGRVGGLRDGTGTFGRLDDLCRALELDAEPASETHSDELPPFRGGLIGFFGYDVAPLIERLPRRLPRDSRLPDVRLALYDTFATIDHTTGCVAIWAADLLGEGLEPTRRRLSRFECRLRAQAPNAALTMLAAPPVSNFARAEYEAVVERALEYIRAGDVFQVNLSQRFEAFARSVDPLDLHRRLRRTSPAPFSALIRWRDLAVVSASPELFFSTSERHILTRPIKGTRPRDPDPIEDARLAAELAESGKDRAELTMIVDLERNDLGRICEYGTVRVVEPYAIESFAQVHHLLATVEGQLRRGVGAVDIARAVLPGGSITGAPKIRAMQIIDELERNRRSLYTGAIGFLGRGGHAAFNIAIRTLLVEGKRLTYQVGGGIVSDSDPSDEYEETLHKGRGLLDVLLGGGTRP